MGLSDKPTVAHDTSIQAGDLALMDALGHWLKVTCDTHHRLAWLRPMKQPGEPEALGLPCHETCRCHVFSCGHRESGGGQVVGGGAVDGG